MPRAAFPMSATASQAGGAVLAEWLEATRRLWLSIVDRKSPPDPTVSQAARVMGECARAARLSKEATIAARRAEMNAQLQRERDAGLVCGKPRP